MLYSYAYNFTQSLCSALKLRDVWARPHNAILNGETTFTQIYSLKKTVLTNELNKIVC